MGTKNISLKESAYEKLLSLKREDESFSDLIERLTRDRTPKYTDLAGILSEDTIETIERTRERRKKVDEAEFRKMSKRFEDDKQ